MRREIKLNPGSEAEYKGLLIGDKMLAEMGQLNEHVDQAVAIRLLQNAILDICELPRKDRAAGGFASSVADRLLRSLRGKV